MRATIHFLEGVRLIGVELNLISEDKCFRKRPVYCVRNDGACLVSEFVKWCSQQRYREVEKTKVAINLKIPLYGPHEFPRKKLRMENFHLSVVCQRCLMPTLPDKFICVNMALSICNFSGESDRDVFNEKPSREEILAATQVNGFFFNLYCTHTLLNNNVERKN